eukprot:CAMPEP_0185018462 /NCGR_PEP_ID=MMETSP1103-20130426/1172_1 /TAXON_ID=36769 /ORGANISM="Paraphysomonas bandaiensis, Strain Caron Lab Isolate" /LENGTH=1414 /DNA_ID=CAMNT_0027548275 /DNA_START=447 /DNA_END=4691 /DNA_ORIENTATION=-
MDEDSNTISPVLNTLCEYPVISLPLMRYDIRLSGGTLPLNFNAIGLVDDEDMNLIALKLLNPQMLVETWEALLLENKVLVISSVPAVVPYCCEFVRRLVLPLVVINTYVPFLPDELLSTIEAPFPYLVGAQSEAVYRNRVDLSDTFVVDLDAQVVRPPSNGSYSTDRAPASMKSRVVQEINTVLLEPLATWACRALDPVMKDDGVHVQQLDREDCLAAHPHSSSLQKKSSDSILQCFIRLNLSLFGARHCDVRAFYRRCERPFSKSKHHFNLPKHKGPDGRVSSMGFSHRSGVICGCMQLLNERKDIDVLQFLPCWIEMDTVVFAVHEHADELPLIFVLIKDIVAVSPSPAEPEGHVFDIQIKSQMTYRFAATDPESRREWIREIEKITSVSQEFHASPLPGASGVQHQLSTNSVFSDDNSAAESLQDDRSKYTSEDESDALSIFRSKIVQTQMVSFFKSRTEFHEYESILQEHSMSFDDLTLGSIVLVDSGDTTEEPTPSTDTMDSCSLDENGKSCAENQRSCIGRKGSYIQPPYERNSSKGPSDFETTMCSDAVIKNIKLIWGLYVSGDLVTTIGPDISRYSSHQQDTRRNGVAMRKSNINTESAYWLVQNPICQAASLAFLGRDPRDYRSFEDRKSRISLLDQSENVEKQSSNWSPLSSLLRPFQNKDDTESTSRSAAIKDELNVAIKEELLLRHAAGELLQRIAATHRQCEADLRKLLVQTKMRNVADVMDVNCTLSEGRKEAVIKINIDLVARLSVGKQGEGPPNSSRNSCLNKSWSEVMSRWTGGIISPPCMSRQSSGDISVGKPHTPEIKHQDFFFCMPSVDGCDEVNMRRSMVRMDSCTADSMCSVEDTDFSVLSPLDTSHVGTTKKVVYISPEADGIRRQIRRVISGHLRTCLTEDAPDQNQVLVPVLSAMKGYVCGRLTGGEKEAIGAYSVGALGDQVRIMRCLVDVFIGYTRPKKTAVELDTVAADLCDTKDSELSGADAANITTEEEFRNCPNEPSLPREAGMLLTSSQVEHFLCSSVEAGEMIGLQAVRFLTELMHRCLTRRMAERIVEQTTNLPIQSFQENVLSEFKREVAFGIYSRKRVSLSNMQPSFIWVNAALTKKSEVLNEVVMCTMSASKPCELSIQLLNSLREMLRASRPESQDNMEGEPSPLSAMNHLAGLHRLNLTDKQREALCTSSAFRSFEVQSCQLQMVDIVSMDDNTKTVFFSNMFNVITVHGLIVRGYTGNGFYDKCNFMRTTKYNINGQIFNLLEIEHTILRAQSSSPNSIVGPFIHVSERSPKVAFALKKPMPLVTFTLFQAAVSSPPLTTLWDPSSVESELKRAAAAYLHSHARVDSKTRTLLLPEVFKWYWRDFGGSKKAVLNTVLLLIGRDSKLYDDITKYVDQTKPRISHIPYDWTLVLLM